MSMELVPTRSSDPSLTRGGGYSVHVANLYLTLSVLLFPLENVACKKIENNLMINIIIMINREQIND